MQHKEKYKDREIGFVGRVEGWKELCGWWAMGMVTI